MRFRYNYQIHLKLVNVLLLEFIWKTFYVCISQGSVYVSTANVGPLNWDELRLAD